MNRDNNSRSVVSRHKASKGVVIPGVVVEVEGGGGVGVEGVMLR